jgi:hypothetical protein
LIRDENRQHNSILITVYSRSHARGAILGVSVKEEAMFQLGDMFMMNISGKTNGKSLTYESGSSFKFLYSNMTVVSFYISIPGMKKKRRMC